MSKDVYLDAPNIGELEKEFLCRAVDSGFVSTIGPFVEEFERQFSRYLAVDRAVSVQSGTASLHLALHELGIGPGDEVIVPALTFIATVNPVSYVGATPVFVDVDRDTWTIDPPGIENAVTERTRAIIPVHLFGNPCAMDAIMAIARRHNLFVIEDATESLGATFRNRLTGTIGDFGCFSFNGNKIITTGGGGMVVGRVLDRLAHIKFLVNQGRDESNGYFHPEIGFNYRMTNIEAALGLAQLVRLDTFLGQRKKLNQCYRNEFDGTDLLRLQGEHLNGTSACWLTCGTVAAEIDIPSLQSALREQRIQTRRVFLPLTEQPPYKKFVRIDCPTSREIYRQGICLPSSTLNGHGDISGVCEAIRKHAMSRGPRRQTGKLYATAANGAGCQL
ncbi:MAG TPA: aminotransferase class I/II-fold pyridoxal phosphate-dependent enzyme [Geobacteraceae bacterium]|nr:aminotransferase class I/II-fold pyridoxal phosphate-dependent enzyme [Geobacteraceae bacterium]